MLETYGWLIHFGFLLAFFALILFFAAPEKRKFSLPLLLYAVVMVFVADEIRSAYGRSNLAYSVLNVSAGFAVVLLILLVLFHGILKPGLTPWVPDRQARWKIADAVFWFSAGCVIPFVWLEWRFFARYAGSILIPLLVLTVLVALALFFALRRRGWLRTLLFLLPGYAVGLSASLAISLFYGAKVSSSAFVLAQGATYCVLGGATSVNSVLDMTPLTLISREFSEYHAELVVEKATAALAYNWSWINLSFSPIPADRMHSAECPKL